MTGTMGRPQNYKTEDIINIIDAYVAFTGGTVLLNASKIAQYANDKLGLINFRYYAINRNPDAKKYLADLNEKISGISDKNLSTSRIAFTQIDVKCYMAMKDDELQTALNNLNILMEDMANTNTELIKENVKLKNHVVQCEAELRKLHKEKSDEYNECIKNASDLKDKASEQKSKVKELKIKVKQQEDFIHIMWDQEAEKILKTQGIFENDGVELDEKRVITDINIDVSDVAKDVSDVFPTVIDDKVSYALINKLKNI